MEIKEFIAVTSVKLDNIHADIIVLKEKTSKLENNRSFVLGVFGAFSAMLTIASVVVIFVHK